MVDKVKKYIEQHQMIQKGDTIILGISGGADSVCLLFVLLELQAMYEIQIVGVHVNHNLRGEDAVRDQKFVEHICKEYQVPCVVVSVNVKEEAILRKKSIEEAGRDVRKEAFAKACVEIANGTIKKACAGTENGTIKIATAHHQNDNAETMLMNLARGTGLSGLTGIQPVCGTHIRPLLCVSRNEIEEFLSFKNQKYCIDHTNDENVYTRNAVRNLIVPQLEKSVNAQTVNHMNQSMEELSKIEAYIQGQTQEMWRLCVKEKTEENGLIICKDPLQKQPDILRERVMKQALEQVAKCQKDITRNHITQLLELLEKQVGRQIHLPYGVIGQRVYDGIELYVKNEMESLENSLINGMKMEIPGKTYLSDGSVIETEILLMCGKSEMQETPYTKYFECDIISEIPYIRKRDTGDYIVINENGNRQTIKKYYVTNKVQEQLRDRIPLITIGNEVLWIVGYRRSSNHVTNKNTNKVLKIEYRGGNNGRNS